MLQPPTPETRVHRTTLFVHYVSPFVVHVTGSCCLRHPPLSCTSPTFVMRVIFLLCTSLHLDETRPSLLPTSQICVVHVTSLCVYVGACARRLVCRDVIFAPQIRSYWPKMGQIWDFLRSVSVHFGSPRINLLILLLKSHRFVPFWANMT